MNFFNDLKLSIIKRICVEKVHSLQEDFYLSLKDEKKQMKGKKERKKREKIKYILPNVKINNQIVELAIGVHENETMIGKVLEEYIAIVELHNE